MYKFKIFLESFLKKKEVKVKKIKALIEIFQKWSIKEIGFAIIDFNSFKEELKEDWWFIETSVEDMEEAWLLSGVIDKITYLGNFLQHFSYNFYDWFCFSNSYFYYRRTPGTTEMKFADLFFMEKQSYFFGKNLKIFSDTQEKLVLVNRKDNPEEFTIEDVEDKKISVKFSTEYVVSEDLWCKVSPSKMYVMIHEEDFFYKEEFLEENEKKQSEEQKAEIRLPEEVGGKKVIYMDNLYPQRDVPDSFLRHIFGRPDALLFFDTIADNLCNSLFNKSEKEAYEKKIKIEAIVEKTKKMIKKEKEAYEKKIKEEEQLEKEKKMTKKEKEIHEKKKKEKEQLEKEKGIKKKEKEERLKKEKTIAKKVKGGKTKRGKKKEQPLDSEELQKKKLKEEELKQKKKKLEDALGAYDERQEIVKELKALKVLIEDFEEENEWKQIGFNPEKKYSAEPEFDSKKDIFFAEILRFYDAFYYFMLKTEKQSQKEVKINHFFEKGWKQFLGEVKKKAFIFLKSSDEMTLIERAFNELINNHLDLLEKKKDKFSLSGFFFENPSYLRVLDNFSAKEREDFIFSFNSLNIFDADDFDFELTFVEHWFHYDWEFFDFILWSEIQNWIYMLWVFLLILYFLYLL